MASAGTVTVDFAAETAKFTAELKKVNDRLKGMEGGFESVSRLARNFLPAVSVGALVGFASASFQAADALADTAKRVGVTTEQLSRLKFAAEQNDVEFGTLTTSITRYLKTLSEANTGQKSAIGTLNELGLSASALRSVSLDQQLGLIADAFKGITDPADRTRIAMELFGKSGAELIPLLQGGSEELEKWAAAADKAGITMSTVTAAGIDAIDSAWKSFKNSVGGNASSLIGGIGLALFGTDDQMVNMQLQLQKLQILKAQIGATPGGQQTAAFGNLQQEITQLETRLKGLADLKAGIVSQDAGGQRTAGKGGAALGEFQIFGAAAQGETQASGWQVVAEANAEFQRSMLETSRNITVEALDESGQLALQAQRELGTQVNQEIEYQLQQESALRDYYAQQRYQSEAMAEQAIVNAKRNALTAGLQALQAFAGQSKKAAVALVLINKARSIAEAIQNTIVGATRQLTTGDPYTAIPRAAAVSAWGAIQVAAIAATGYGEIQSINSSGSGGAPLGSPSNPVFTDSGTNANGEDNLTFGADSRGATQVIIQGTLLSNRETADWLIEQIREGIDGRDMMIIGPNSQQAAMLGAT